MVEKQNFKTKIAKKFEELRETHKNSEGIAED